MTDFLLGLASFALVLSPLVVIHEFGHFIAAKLVGITVLEFGIGFPPRAKILFTKGDTIYTLNWLRSCAFAALRRGLRQARRTS